MANNTIMKKILTFSLLLTLGAGMFDARAFDREDYFKFRNDITLHYGIGSAQSFVNILSGAFMIIPSAINHMEFDTFHSTGAIGVSYQRCLNKVVSVGAVVNYDRGWSKYHNKNDASITGIFSTDWLSLMATLRLYWFRTPGFAMYSKFALGAGLMGSSAKSTKNGETEKTPYNPSVTWSAQISPIGLEFGGRFRGFLENGFGMEGILVGGIKYYF